MVRKGSKNSGNMIPNFQVYTNVYPEQTSTNTEDPLSRMAKLIKVHTFFLPCGMKKKTSRMVGSIKNVNDFASIFILY